MSADAKKIGTTTIMYQLQTAINLIGYDFWFENSVYFSQTNKQKLINDPCSFFSLECSN